MVDEVGGGIRHAAPATGRAEPPALAREGNEAVVPTGVAVHAHEAVGEYAAFEIGAEFTLDETCGGCSLFAGI